MLQTTRAIVLHTLRYGDAALIAHLYTEAVGRAPFMVYASHSRRSKVHRSALQPLALVEVQADFRPGADLFRMKEVRVAHPLATLPYDPRKAAVAMYLAEFLYRALREQAENRPLFDYLWHSVAYLDECREGLANFHLVFLLRLSRFLGLYPNLEGYRSGASFDLMAANFTLLPPTQPAHCLSPADAARLPLLMRLNFRTMRLLRMSRAERTRCLELIHTYYRLHLPDLPELRSRDVLREVFDSGQ